MHASCLLGICGGGACAVWQSRCHRRFPDAAWGAGSTARCTTAEAAACRTCPVKIFKYTSSQAFTFLLHILFSADFLPLHDRYS
jgi:hypothetical protein